MTQRVLCFGGRDFTDAPRVDAALAQLLPLFGFFAIIHGDARGADRLAGEWGRAKGLPVLVVPANWTVYGNRAGSLRNGWMLEHCAPTYAVEFPGGSGTANMRAKLDAASVTVWRPYS